MKSLLKITLIITVNLQFPSVTWGDLWNDACTFRAKVEKVQPSPTECDETEAGSVRMTLDVRIRPETLDLRESTTEPCWKVNHDDVVTLRCVSVPKGISTAITKGADIEARAALSRECQVNPDPHAGYPACDEWRHTGEYEILSMKASR